MEESPAIVKYIWMRSSWKCALYIWLYCSDKNSMGILWLHLFKIVGKTQTAEKRLTSAGPSLLSRCVPRECRLPVCFCRPTPPAILWWSLLQARPLLPILGMEPSPMSALLHLAMDLTLPGQVRLPLALPVCTWSHSSTSPSVFIKSCAPGAWSSTAVSVRRRLPPAVIWLGEPCSVLPKVWLWGKFALIAWAPATADDDSSSTDNWQSVAILHIGLFHILCISIWKS